MTARVHPLFGELLEARGFKRFDGVVHLVVELPDGSPGTIRVDATDVLAVVPGEVVGTALNVEGVQALRRLVVRLSPAGGSTPGRGGIAGGGNA